MTNINIKNVVKGNVFWHKKGYTISIDFIGKGESLL